MVLLAQNMVFLFGLAPGGVYRAISIAADAVGSYPTFSPLPQKRGGIFSVALSLGSPPPGVTRHRISMEPGLSSLHHLSALCGAAVQPADTLFCSEISARSKKNPAALGTTGFLDSQTCFALSATHNARYSTTIFAADWVHTLCAMARIVFQNGATGCFPTQTVGFA